MEVKAREEIKKKSSRKDPIKTVEIEHLEELNQAIPRYTSYPTAPEWEDLGYQVYEDKLKAFKKSGQALSLYCHIPFCRSMCLFCGCAVTLNRNEERQERYVQFVMKEIDLIHQFLGASCSVRQLHFGGGTPTQLTARQLGRLFEKMSHAFSIDFSGEISIEVDPRTVVQDRGGKLRLLKALGFNRVSFGIQDTNEKVQQAIRRKQSYAQSKLTYELARQVGFESINCDFIYGLPFQTLESFEETCEKIIDMRPDRIALYSFAKTPWLKPHQKAIKEDSLPSTNEKFLIYQKAREKLIDAGYWAIGMDHFVLPEDSMAQAYRSKSLQRNFQGYSVRYADDLIGLGVTSTGFLQGSYFQNVKELEDYYSFIDKGILPVFKGKVLNPDDRMRYWVIQTLMCDLELSKQDFTDRFGRDFDGYFAKELKVLQELENENLVNVNAVGVYPTRLGSLFIRNIASVFDAYLSKSAREGRFSKAV